MFLSVLGFGVGILIHTYVFSSWILVSIAAFLALLFFFLFVAHQEQRTFLFTTFCFIGIALGLARTELLPSGLPYSLAEKVDTRVVLEGVIVANPDVREINQHLTVEIVEEQTRARILVITARLPERVYGERVRVEGILTRPEPFETNTGRVFAYDRFLEKDEIFGIVEYAQVEHTGNREGWQHIPGFLYDVKQACIRALNVSLPEPHASLASGLIVGGKQGLGKELLDDFIVAGLIHIVVLSGYNVMIVADFIMRLFGLLSRRYRAVAGGASILLFVLAAGAGPASLRAGLMALIALYARATGRSYEAFRALVCAGFLMVLVSPLTLPYDPGFQLSFIATLGLIFGAPMVERWLSFMKHAFLREIVATTIAAQIAVLPLLLYQNGLLSLVAFPANLLVLPTVPLAMLLSFVAVLGGLLVAPLASIIALPAYMVLSYIIAIAETTAGFSFAAVSVPPFSFVFVVGMYSVLGYVVYRFRARSLALKTVSQPHAN